MPLESDVKARRRSIRHNGACDGCGSRPAAYRPSKVDPERSRFPKQVLVCCVYVPMIKHPWCAWCGEDVDGTYFCGPGCSHDFALDVIDSQCRMEIEGVKESRESCIGEKAVA